LGQINSKSFSFLSPQNERDKISLKLSRMKKSLKKLDNPCIDIPAIQIIGTNGKGSITAFLESICSLANIKIGVTTSPHLLEITERIRVNQTQIKIQTFEYLLEDIQKEVSEFRLTPFELIICCALKYFESNNVELIILEAGLGGRLDATTAHNLRPIIAIGNIGLDHTEYLGNSIEKITQEKISVIKKDSFVVSCKQDHKVEKLINKRVESIGAKIFWVEPLSEDWELGLNGAFQKQNAAVAFKVANLLLRQGWHIKKEIIRKGLAKAKWSGRLEVINWKNKKVLVDSAHNPSAAAVLANERKNWLYQEKGIYWIIGVQKQKDIASIIEVLREPLDKIFLVPIQNQESWTLNDILKVPNFNIQNITEYKSLEDALHQLLNLGEWPEASPVLTGSIYLVAEFIKFSKIS